MGWTALAALAIACAVVVAAVRADDAGGPAAVVPSGAYTNIYAGDYVGPAVCAECHAERYDQWRGNLHRSMNQRIGPEAVIGDFDSARLEYAGGSVQFHRSANDYLMTFGRAGEPPRRYRVTRTIGSRYLQEYVGVDVSSPNPTEIRLPFGWWVRGGGWFHQQYFDSWYGPESEVDSFEVDETPWDVEEAVLPIEEPHELDVDEELLEIEVAGVGDTKEERSRACSHLFHELGIVEGLVALESNLLHRDPRALVDSKRDDGTVLGVLQLRLHVDEVEALGEVQPTDALLVDLDVERAVQGARPGLQRRLDLRAPHLPQAVEFHLGDASLFLNHEPDADPFAVDGNEGLGDGEILAALPEPLVLGVQARSGERLPDLDLHLGLHFAGLEALQPFDGDGEDGLAFGVLSGSGERGPEKSG